MVWRVFDDSENSFRKTVNVQWPSSFFQKSAFNYLSFTLKAQSGAMLAASITSLGWLLLSVHSSSFQIDSEARVMFCRLSMHCKDFRQHWVGVCGWSFPRFMSSHLESKISNTGLNLLLSIMFSKGFTNNESQDGEVLLSWLHFWSKLHYN